jgi:hypothetical protein
VLVVYLLVVQFTSFLHHDTRCHRTSRTHCTACSIALTASTLAADVATRLRSLLPAERLITGFGPACAAVPRSFASDSSPPSTSVEL